MSVVLAVFVQLWVAPSALAREKCPKDPLILVKEYMELEFSGATLRKPGKCASLVKVKFVPKEVQPSDEGEDRPIAISRSAHVTYRKPEKLSGKNRMRVTFAIVDGSQKWVDYVILRQPVSKNEQENLGCSLMLAWPLKDYVYKDCIE